jgi:long-chain acyl-CoA synthetase
MTAVTRIFDFPYYQLEQYSSIADALATKKNGV